MIWKSQLPDDIADLIAILRSEAFDARAIDEDDDWDEDLEGGPEIIYARGDGGNDDDIEDVEDVEDTDEIDE